MPQESFKRYEKKYLLTKEQYEQLLSGMEGHIRKDAYGSYAIHNIYFDTPDHALIRASLDKPFYKEKLRLRSYGVPTPDTPVFLEIKKKYNGIVYKRRTTLSLEEAENYLYSHTDKEGSGQVLREIDWLFARYPLKPSVYLVYDRLAYCGIEDDSLRITFDTNIRGRDERLKLTEGTDGIELLDPDTVLMEVKFIGAMPLWMSRLFASLKIYPSPFSKYGIYYRLRMQSSDIAKETIV